MMHRTIEDDMTLHVYVVPYNLVLHVMCFSLSLLGYMIGLL